MPVYVYECEPCKIHVERTFPVELRDEAVICYKCSKLMTRTIAPTNFVLKGDCWGKDGYTK
jgi:predicted nucleic acid-binding Zn ribbon protein